MTVAPIPQILPSFVPVQIEQALAGYYEVPLQLEGERRLTECELRHVIAASSFLGTHLFCSQTGFDFAETETKLADSLFHIPQVSAEDRSEILELVKAFHNYPILRADHALDDWIAESWWSKFQTCTYGYPTAMSGAVAHGIGIVDALKTFRIET